MLTWCGRAQKDDAMVLLAAKWGCMSDEEKVPYYEKAKEVKAAERDRVWSLFIIYMIMNLTASRKGHVMYVTIKYTSICIAQFYAKCL